MEDKFFTPEQLAILGGKLDTDDVKNRPGANGRKLSYVEGWYVLDMANEVFGFGNWDLETTEMIREHEPVPIPPTEENPKGGIVVSYSSKVRLTVYSMIDPSKKRVRERTGGHRGFGPTVGQAIEDARKAAETDATKRAFITFGNVFGLALYDKDKRGVGKNAEQRQLPPPQGRAPFSIAPIDEGFGDVQPPQHQSNSQRALAASSRPPQGNSVQPDNRRQLNGSALPANAY